MGGIMRDLLNIRGKNYVCQYSSFFNTTEPLKNLSAQLAAPIFATNNKFQLLAF